MQRRFWMSWVQPGEDYRPLTFPPNEAILGWWCSGFTDGGATLCALVSGNTEDGAKAAVHLDWPEVTEWRFVSEVNGDFILSDRFVVDADWMKERLAAARS